MSNSIIQRDEMLTATLNFGGIPISLADYATTGLVGLGVAPRGNGKTNAGLLMAEQLSEQGWISLLVCPEGELQQLYGGAVDNPAELQERLEKRDVPIVVINARDATEFLPYGRVILDCADRLRKPIFVVIDEGQLFSATSPKRDKDLGEALEIINDLIGRGRKRGVDLYITALSFKGSLSRFVFANKNFTLIGCQEDPAVWAGLSPQFRSSDIRFSDLNTLAPGEFMCISRRGVEKVRLPLAAGLKNVARKAQRIKRVLPSTFSEWSRAMEEIPTERLKALSDPVVQLLSAVVGLTSAQMQAGTAALKDELEIRG